MTTAVLSKELYHALQRRNGFLNKRDTETEMLTKQAEAEERLAESQEKLENYIIDSNDVSTFNASLAMYNNATHSNGNTLPLNLTTFNGDDIDLIPEYKGRRVYIERIPGSNDKYILYSDGKKQYKSTAKAYIQDISRWCNKYLNNSGPKLKWSAEQNYRKRKEALKHSYFDTLERSKTEPMYDELYHHGIFGMKWGIRRYQNEDGTLTPEGRKRYLLNYVDVDEKGNTKLAAVGDADKRRRDLEKQEKKDARSELMKNPAFRMGAILGSGGAATSASLGLIGSLGLANPAVAAAGVAGSGILGGLGFGIGSHIGKKQTGLDEPDVWGAKNLKKYDVDTSNLGYDVKWLKTSELAKFKNDLNRRNLVDSIYNNNATVKMPKKK